MYGDPKFAFPYVPSHLHHMTFELVRPATSLSHLQPICHLNTCIGQSYSDCVNFGCIVVCPTTEGVLLHSTCIAKERWVTGSCFILARLS